MRQYGNVGDFTEQEIDKQVIDRLKDLGVLQYYSLNDCGDKYKSGWKLQFRPI